MVGLIVLASPVNIRSRRLSTACLLGGDDVHVPCPEAGGPRHDLLQPAQQPLGAEVGEGRATRHGGEDEVVGCHVGEAPGGVGGRSLPGQVRGAKVVPVRAS